MSIDTLLYTAEISEPITGYVCIRCSLSSSSFFFFIILQETFSIYIFFLHNLDFCFHFLDAPLPPLSLQKHCPYSVPPFHLLLTILYPLLTPFPPSPHPLFLFLTPFTFSSPPSPSPHSLYLFLTPFTFSSLPVSAPRLESLPFPFSSASNFQTSPDGFSHLQLFLSSPPSFRNPVLSLPLC